jgi:hypothetical protein
VATTDPVTNTRMRSNRRLDAPRQPAKAF